MSDPVDSASADSAWQALRGIERLSLCDWPGRASAVLFFGGCNLRCPFCHNAGIAWTPERHPGLFAPDVKKFCASRAKWLDGIVVSGGEPTLVHGLPAFLAELRAYNLPVKLDTNGTRPEVVAHLLAQGLIAAASVDVKAPYRKYAQATGGLLGASEAESCLGEIFSLAAANPGRFMFRATVTPELTSDDLAEMRAMLPAGHRLTEQPYVKPEKDDAYANSDSQARRARGNLVAGADSPSHPEGPQGQRGERPDPRQTAGR